MRKNRNRGARSDKNVLVFRKGHKLVVPNHPPEFCSRPWYPLVIAIRDVGTTLTLTQIATAISNQLGLSGGNLYNFRLISVRIWGPIPATNTPLTCIFKDVFDDIAAGQTLGAQTEMEVITNYADQVNRARCGFEYSSVQQAKSLVATSGLADEVVRITGAGTGSVAYLKLLWRSFNASALRGAEDEQRQQAINPAFVNRPPGWIVV